MLHMYGMMHLSTDDNNRGDNKMSVWRNNPDLMDRLQKAQNKSENWNIDIMTIAGFFETREQLERHVERYENKGSV